MTSNWGVAALLFLAGVWLISRSIRADFLPYYSTRAQLVVTGILYGIAACLIFVLEPLWIQLSVGTGIGLVVGFLLAIGLPRQWRYTKARIQENGEK